MISVPILSTERFILRPLTGDDVSLRYLSWLADPSSHILASQTTHSLNDLASYVEQKAGQPDVAFIGIFDRVSGLHVGNVKFEPIDLTARHAVLGILIGDADYRGRGVAGEVIQACACWLKTLGIIEIVLGVAHDNIAAVRAYEKVGFRMGATPHLPHIAGRHTMTLPL